MAAESTAVPVPSLAVAGGDLTARVRALRTARGWSIHRLAAEAGLKRATVSLLERGGSRPIARTCERLADAFGLVGTARREFLSCGVAHAPLPTLPARGRFGVLLRRLRLRARQSQGDLGRRVGCEPNYVVRLESGVRRAPGRPLVEALARGLALGVVETDALLLAAGHLPSWAGDRTIRQVAALLAGDPVLAAGLRAQVSALTKMVREDGED